MKIRASLKSFDNPIASYEEDLLKRRGFVRQLSQILAEASPNQSNVFALYGEWGAGKTSVINLLKLELEKVGKDAPLAIEFNPWVFSAQDQLLEAFFSEVGQAIGRHPQGKKAGTILKRIGTFFIFGAKLAKTAHLAFTASNQPDYSILANFASSQLDEAGKNAKEYAEEIKQLSELFLEDAHKTLKQELAKLKRTVLVNRI
jgi:predicted KAP-like P-loop ATPase